MPIQLFNFTGEVRSTIAPRKPERTASMREREARLQEMQRRRPIGDAKNSMDSLDSSYSSSSKDDSFESSSSSDTLGSEESVKLNKEFHKNDSLAKKDNDDDSTKSTENFNERKKKIQELENIQNTAGKLSSKIEIFENNAKQIEASRQSQSPATVKTTYFLNDNLKNSVQKMNNTIDSYLKNKKLSVSDSNLLYDNGSASGSSASSSPSPSMGVGSANAPASSTPLHGTNSRNYIRNNSNNVSNIELRTTPSSGNAYETITIGGSSSSTISMMTPQKYQAPTFQRSSYPDSSTIFSSNDLSISSPSPQGSAMYRNFGVFSPVPAQSSSFGEFLLLY